MNLPNHIYGKYLTFRERIYNFFATITGLTIFNWEIFKQFFIPPYEIEEIKKHMNELGVKTFPIVSVTGFVIGLVIVMQSEPVFIRFGASDLLPWSNGNIYSKGTWSCNNCINFCWKGKFRYRRRIGSMRVTEQIDAMEVSAVHPFNYLVVSRMVATTMILPILTIYVIFLINDWWLHCTGNYLEEMSLEYYKNAIVVSMNFG